MDAIEHIESRRWGVLVLSGTASFFICFAMSKALFYSVALGIGVGTLVSGCWVAYKSTRGVAWANIESEARLNGYGPSKVGIWLGNVLVGSTVVGLAHWLLRGV